MPLASVPPSSQNEMRSGSVEATYKKLTQHQHILQRPDTYVGSIEAHSSEMWVVNAEGRRDERMHRTIGGWRVALEGLRVGGCGDLWMVCE